MIKIKVGTQFIGYDNTCSCRIDKDGKPLGRCLRCFDIYMEGFRKGVIKERKRIERIRFT